MCHFGNKLISHFFLLPSKLWSIKIQDFLYYNLHCLNNARCPAQIVCLRNTDWIEANMANKLYKFVTSLVHNICSIKSSLKIFILLKVQNTVGFKANRTLPSHIPALIMEQNELLSFIFSALQFSCHLKKIHFGSFLGWWIWANG